MRDVIAAAYPGGLGRGDSSSQSSQGHPVLFRGRTWLCGCCSRAVGCSSLWGGQLGSLPWGQSLAGIWAPWQGLRGCRCSRVYSCCIGLSSGRFGTLSISAVLAMLGLQRHISMACVDEKKGWKHLEMWDARHIWVCLMSADALAEMQEVVGLCCTALFRGTA